MEIFYCYCQKQNSKFASRWFCYITYHDAQSIQYQTFRCSGKIKSNYDTDLNQAVFIMRTLIENIEEERMC